MSGNNSPMARFPLPENWDLDEFICMVIPVPNDPDYIAMMEGLIETLTWQRSFTQHPTENATYQVSKSWEKAFASKDIRFIGCDMPELRINPDTCLLEVDCGEDNWKPVFTSDHPQGSPKVPYPPDTPEYEDNTAHCIAAANIAAALKSGTNTLAHDATIVGGIALAIINLIGAFLFFVPYGFLVDIGIAILDLAVGHTIEEFGDDYDLIDWENVRDHLACYIERDGTMTESGRAEFIAWMDDQYSGNLAWGLAKIIVNNVSADGLTSDARIPQNDIDISCDHDYCDGFSHTFDFLVSNGSWSLPAAGNGTWTLDDGWRNNWTGSIAQLRVMADGFPERYINYVDITYNTFGYPYDEFNCFLTTDGSGTTITGTDIATGVRRFTIESNATVLRFDMARLGYGEYVFTQAVVVGEGTDPY